MADVRGLPPFSTCCGTSSARDMMGSPRALGLDDQGREVLTYIEGEVGNGEGFLPDKGGRFDLRLPDYVWRDNVLERLGQCCDPTTMLQPASYGEIANGDLKPATPLKRSATMT
ncbi:MULTISPECIES: hypothetical protein [Rhizobium]|uniref:hypothetical protein n=1 Tax=Rhizobium TaxID=379 RepID=UPI001E42A3E5|nr:hypothetical protein [Rhizobium leguminosarum]UFW80862.1 hypothetical protein RlegSU303_03790 [Rhizobium leguminosarum bv. viciae]